MKKINFQNKTNPPMASHPRINASTLNEMQNNIEEEIDALSSRLEAEWVNLTLETGIFTTENAYGGSNTLQAKKQNNRVFVRGSFAMTNYDGNAKNITKANDILKHNGNNIYFWAPLSGSRLGRYCITSSGIIILNWIINLANGTNVANTEIPWIQINCDFEVK